MKCQYHPSHRDASRAQDLHRDKWTSDTIRPLGHSVIWRWMSSRFLLSAVYLETDWSPRCINRISRPSAPKVFKNIPQARLEQDVSLRPPMSSIRNMIRVSLRSFFCQRNSESKMLESKPDNGYLHRSETDRFVAVSGHVARSGPGICRWRPNYHRRRRRLAGGLTCPRYECHQASLIAVSLDVDKGKEMPGTTWSSTGKERKTRSTVSSKRCLRGMK